MIERKDKLKNKAKVIKTTLINPLNTDRETAKELWIWKSTVNRIKQELGQDGTKDDRIIGLTDEDFNLMLDIQKEKKRRLQEEKGELNNNDIDKWENTATKRYSLFRWDATDKEWAIKNIENIEIL